MKVRTFIHELGAHGLLIEEVVTIYHSNKVYILSSNPYHGVSGREKGVVYIFISDRNHRIGKKCIYCFIMRT